MSPPRARSGFALVEIVVALAVTAFALSTIVALLSVAASSSKAATDDTLTATMALSVIDDLRRQYFADATHTVGAASVLPGTTDVATGATPAVATPAPVIFFDASGTRLKYTSGASAGLDMVKVDALAAGAIYQCTETLQGDPTTLSATGSDGSTTKQAINYMNVTLTFVWPVQATNPPNSKVIYAGLARY
jgi:type II secretory pathway pseudopilin PulG